MKYTPFKYLGAGMAALCISATPVKATPLPDQINVIVPFAPGGAVDVLARLLTKQLAPALPFLQDKRIKILGIANPKSDMFSGVKEVAGIQYFSDIEPETAAQSWIALFAPAGTDTGMVDQLHDAVQKVLASESFTNKLIPMGMVPNISSRNEFSAKVQNNIDFWKKTIEQPAIANQ